MVENGPGGPFYTGGVHFQRVKMDRGVYFQRVKIDRVPFSTGVHFQSHTGLHSLLQAFHTHSAVHTHRYFFK